MDDTGGGIHIAVVVTVVVAAETVAFGIHITGQVFGDGAGGSVGKDRRLCRIDFCHFHARACIIKVDVGLIFDNIIKISMSLCSRYSQRNCLGLRFGDFGSQSADRHTFVFGMTADLIAAGEQSLIILAGDRIIVGGGTDLGAHYTHGVAGLGHVGIYAAFSKHFVEFFQRNDLAGGFTQDGVGIDLGISEFSAAFGNAFGTGDVVGAVIEETAVDLDRRGLTVLHHDFALGKALGFANGGHEVQITGVPFGIEVPVGSTAVAIVFDGTGEEGTPVAAGKHTGRKEVNTFVVFPALEVHADTVIVFSIDFNNAVSYFEFRNGAVILLEHGKHFLPVPFAGFDHQCIEFSIHRDRAGGDFKLRVEFRRTYLNKHVTQIAGTADAGKIDISITGRQIFQTGTVERGNDAVDTFAVIGVGKTVFFGGNQHQTGTITEFDGSHLGGAAVDAFGTDCGFQIAAHCIGISMFEGVGLGDDKGIGVIADDFDFFGAVGNIDLELCLHAGRRIAAGRIVTVGSH